MTTGGRSNLTGFLLFPVILKQIVSPNEIIDFHFQSDIGHISQYPDSYLAWKSPNEYQRNSLYCSSENYDPSTQFDKIINVGLNGSEKELQASIKGILDWKKLHAISIKGKNNNTFLAKTYYFDYTYNNRRKLSFITERQGEYEERVDYIQGYESSGGTHSFVFYPYYIIPPKPQSYNPKEYRFRYNELKFPIMYVNAGEDSWGYYNGGTNFLSDYPIFGIRQPSSYYAKAETLTEIEYPTKSKTLFEYQTHTYSEVVSSSFTSVQKESGSAGGLRISGIRQYSSKGVLLQARNYYYSHVKGSGSSGVLKGLPVYELHYYAPGNVQLHVKTMGGFPYSATQQNSSHIGYSCVIEEIIDASYNTTGYIKYKFSNYNEDIWGISHYDEPVYYSTAVGINYMNSFSSKSMERGNLLSEEYYDSNDRLIKSVSNRYTKVSGETDHLVTANQSVVVFYAPLGFLAKIGSLSKTYTYSCKLSSKIVDVYDSANKGTIFTTKQYYAYNKNKLLCTDSIAGSTALDSYVTSYTYPGDIVNAYKNVTGNASLNMYRELVSLNMLNIPVEVIKRKGSNTVSAITDTYKAGTLMPVKDKTYELAVSVPISNFSKISFTNNGALPLLDSRMDVSVTYNLYDRYDNQVEITHRGINYAYCWSYQGQYLTGMYQNATYSQIGNSDLSIDGRPYVAYKGLKDAKYQNYEYAPSVGITAVSNSRGYTLLYQYDPVGRLLNVSEYINSGNSRILKALKYNYTNR